MKITVVGSFGTENFGLHIAENLEAMGHQVRCCESSRKRDSFGRYGKLNSALRVLDRELHYVSRRTRAYVQRPVLADICREKADLIITTFDFFRRDELEEIRSAMPGVKITMWFPDHVKSFGRAFFMAAGYDALFFKDPFIVRNLHDIYEMNAYYLPEAFSPSRHHVTDDFERRRGEYDCDIAMIGSQHSFRVPLLEKLADYDIRLYGVGSPWWLDVSKIQKFYTGKFAAYEEKANIFAGAKVALNTLYFAEVEGVNVRAFEIAGSGGFQIMQWKPGLPDLFEVDKEVVCYNSFAELREKLDYYLPRAEERHAIAEAGKERAYREHTYEKRLQRMLSMTMGGEQSRHNHFDYHKLA